ncbi:MAG: aminopeptidase [Spirochaetales bacterium]|nr:aminopeptidase [Spirochaetales bacterium]
MDIFFDKYADAIIECALKIKEGDVLSINTEEENGEFAKLLAAKAKAITGNGSYIQRLEKGRIVENYDFMSSSPLTKAPTCFVYIPLFKAFPKLEGDREYDAADLQSFKLLSDPLDNPPPTLPFVTCPLPTDDWDQVLDEYGSSSSSILYNILSLERDDFISYLKRKEESVRYLVKFFNGLDLDKCRIADDEGTDLEFSFLKGSSFNSSFIETVTERVFCPTITSSDIYRLMDPTSLTGWLNISKPIVLWGEIITNLSIRFNGGKIVEYSSNPKGEALMDLYLRQDPLSGRASMITLSEVSSPLFDEDITLIPEYDRMRAISITVGGPKGEAVKEDDIKGTVDSLLSLSLPLGRESTVITALDKDGEEITIYSGGYFMDEEDDNE